MKDVFITSSEEETRNLGKSMASSAVPGTLLCLSGELGSGKTTFSQGFLEGMGASRPYISPTFILMKQYELPRPTDTGIKRVYHADAYRIEGKDFQELGFEEWREDPKGIVLLEWPERLGELLPEKRIDIGFAALSENEREITVTEE